MGQFIYDIRAMFFSTIIRDHVGWTLGPETENKRICQISGLKSGRSRFKYLSLTREFLKQYLTEKQNGFLQSSRSRGVVAMRELTVCHTKWQANYKLLSSSVKNTFLITIL